MFQRTQGSGHGASERDIRAVHEASIANLRKTLDVFEQVRIYYSTTPWTAPRLVASARNQTSTILLMDGDPGGAERVVAADAYPHHRANANEASPKSRPTVRTWGRVYLP